ncbi:MAG: hypothetical protein PVF82_02515 [Gammaproteobacteria bacterium]|jgi:hypothetical protein
MASQQTDQALGFDPNFLLNLSIKVKAAYAALTFCGNCIGSTADPEFLYRALENIIRNACFYTPKDEIGLDITKRAIEVHGGHIQAKKPLRRAQIQ